jgi:hypothetical protein
MIYYKKYNTLDLMLRHITTPKHYVTDTVFPDTENTEMVYNNIMKRIMNCHKKSQNNGV